MYYNRILEFSNYVHKGILGVSITSNEERLSVVHEPMLKFQSILANIPANKLRT
jgi:hypothetical protein